MIAEVILSINNKNVDKAFDYSVPGELEQSLEPGMRVLVPFGKNGRTVEAYVVNIKKETDVEPDKLKCVSAIQDGYAVFSPVMMRLAVYMRDKYYSTLSACLQCILPPGLSLTEHKLNYAYINEGSSKREVTISETLEKGGKQAQVLELLIKSGGMSISDIKKTLGISQSPIDTLAKKGIIVCLPVRIHRMPFKAEKYARFEALNLFPEQTAALEKISRKLEPDYIGLRSVLLHGVTGSGKTEIYLRLIEKAINQGKQAVVLVPEISLTPQTVSRFVGRFSDKVSVTHSRLSDGERFDQWQRAKSGAVSVMIGPRSAIFTPFENLGIIIIDEEHETTYKSETTPKYDVKELAEKLSEYTGCLVVLGSATPSVHTYHAALNGKYELIELKARINNRPPEVKVVDMRKELIKGNRSVFSYELQDAIAENLAKRELTILFLNRRGHSTFVSCRACGHVMSCDMCSINYTYHMYTDRLVCHYCGDEIASPRVCPVCGSEYIKFFGAGTQKVEEQIKKSFPFARVLRMDLDTTSKKNSHEQIYSSFLAGEADILIGTQMIAKGLDFPRVTLVGIIAADISIHMGDFRSAEKSFQLLTQVSGRAGRAELPGRAIIQTYNPEHYSIVYSRTNDYKAFYEHEIDFRQQLDYPPFSHLFVALFTGESEKRVAQCIYKLYEIMKRQNTESELDIFRPTPATVFKIKNIFRHKLIVKAENEEKLKKFVFGCIDELRKNEDLSDITVNSSLDPLNIP